MTSFGNNVFKLISGNIIAQILGIITIPVITRLYSPGDYGVFQLIISISSIITIFSCLSYQLAIMLPKEDEDSINIVALCIMLTILISVISGILLTFFSDDIGKLLNSPDSSSYLVFVPIMVLTGGLFTVLSYWMSRRKKFGTIVGVQVTNLISSKIVQLGFGLCSPSSLGLIAGFIIGYFSSLLILLKVILNDIHLFKYINLLRFL